MRPNVANTTVNGIDGYATSDVLEQHPTKEGFWRILGRTDDQIMHSTGEKVGNVSHDSYTDLTRPHRQTQDHLVRDYSPPSIHALTFHTIESMMTQDPRVAAAVVFGRGRLQAGILVEPKSDYAFNPIDEPRLAEFRNTLW